MLKKIAILSSVVVVLAVAALIGANSAQHLNRADAPGISQQHESGLSGAALGRQSRRLSIGADTRSAVNSTQAGSGDVSRPVPFGGSKVIKTATIEVEVPKGKFHTRFEKASAIAEDLGGFVTDSSVEGSGERPASGTITIRVPVERHVAAMAGLTRLGTLTSRGESGQDVSKEFVDLEARLRHARTQETFYLKLMEEAKSVADLLQIQQQLSNLQLDMEMIQGQLDYLKDQTTYSTVRARIFEPGAAAMVEPKRLGLAWRQATAGFQNVVAGLLIGVGYAAPLAVLVALSMVVWRVTKRKAHPVPTAR